MSKIILTTLFFCCISFCYANAQKIDFKFEQTSKQKDFTFYKIKLRNNTELVQAALTAFNYKLFEFYAVGDTIDLQQWRVVNDTAIFRMQYIAHGGSCMRCFFKAIVLLPDEEKVYYLKVPNTAVNRILQVVNFSMNDYCYKSFIEETKKNDWFEQYKLDTLSFTLR